MTREIYRDMLVNDVIPAIKAKWPQDQKHIPIRLQQDNAKPHVHEDDAEVLAAGCSDGWMMHPLNQPAQSPDLNCLDLGYFASIQTLQSKTHPRTTVDLIKEVKLAFEETTAVTLNKTFLSLQAVMEQNHEVWRQQQLQAQVGSHAQGQTTSRRYAADITTV
ncbi:hypothetical protein PR003_g33509 [Phytophthora rubi]|uniref:Tc1-like transposase DDE domain-containing protein n=1 Tax=Phytophthora rubi TaxID=129364 RepID=A0A6A4AR50_9STRA|nr:hypothetical protein PR003_g33509 [Phytophthora rubi]